MGRAVFLLLIVAALGPGTLLVHEGRGAIGERTAFLIREVPADSRGDLAAFEYSCANINVRVAARELGVVPTERAVAHGYADFFSQAEGIPRRLWPNRRRACLEGLRRNPQRWERPLIYRRGGVEVVITSNSFSAESKGKASRGVENDVVREAYRRAGRRPPPEAFLKGCPSLSPCGGW